MTRTTRKKSNEPITVTEAARMLGLSASAVRSYCRKKGIGQRFTDPFGRMAYLLSHADVEHLSDPSNRPRNGRPRRAAST